MQIDSKRPLRHRLFLLAASGLVPLAIAALFAVAWLVHERQQQAQRAALELSRALAIAVDSELRGTVAVLESLAYATELGTERPQQFHDVAAEIAKSRGWYGLVVADAGGTVVLSSAAPFGRAPAQPVDPESMLQVLASHAPVLGRVRTGPGGRDAFAVRVPVMREGVLRYVLSAVVPAESVLAVVQRQTVPAGWVATVLDPDMNRVARSLPTAARKPSESLQALLAGDAREGSGESVTVEGVDNYTGFTRLASGWTVVVGVSKAEVNRNLYPLLASIAFGVIASLVLSAALAALFTRGVSEPIDALKRAAASLGAGSKVDAAVLGVAELDDVRDALVRAGEERDRLARERSEVQDERDALLVRVTEALRTAQDAARSKDEFLAVLGHELRNPLAPISNALHLMERKGDAATAQERHIIRRQLAHMTRLVDDLLDISRITGKRLVIRMQPLQLAPLVQQSADAVRPLLHGRTLRVDVAPDAADAWVSGDEVRLAQVLANLLGNAIKFTPADGNIAVNLRREGAGAALEVRDDGQGMPRDVVERAFEPFFQAPQETDRPRGGLGLGLAIVRSLVEMHGGTVQAHSDGAGTGCRVVVRLPVIAAPAAAAQEEPQPAAVGHGRVLLVDDNEDAADTTGALLEAAGYEVRVAYEPNGALDALRAFAPDVVLLDIGLPGMSGYELARRMRAAGHRGQLIALTGYGRDSDVASARAASFDRHLTKPVAPDELLQAVGEATAAAKTE